MSWDPTLLRKTVEWLLKHAYHVATVDTADWSDAGETHPDIARTLDFPDYYGRDLDALNDCLGDVACGAHRVRPNVAGLVLVLQSYDPFAARSADTAHELLGIFATQTRRAALLGNRVRSVSSNPVTPGWRWGLWERHQSAGTTLSFSTPIGGLEPGRPVLAHRHDGSPYRLQLHAEA